MFGLSFLYPAFLAGAAAAAVPILLHLLKKETAPPLLFSAVRFLKHAPEERTRRQRLRELLLLALRVAALVWLAAAFARPYLLSGAERPTGVTIVAVDTSFSLSSPGRFDRVRALARQAIDNAEAGHQVGVVAFDDEASVVAEPSLDRAAARAAVDRLQAGFGATRYRAALDRAVGGIGRRAGRVVFVTDLQRSGWRADAEGAVPDGVDVKVAEVGGLPSNLAITALTAERGRASALVRNVGAGSRSARVRLALDDRPVAEVPIRVDPGGSLDVTFDTVLPASGVVHVWLSDPTGCAADDSRYLVLDPPTPALVLVVTPTGDLARDAFYVERALLASGAASRYVLQGVGDSAFPAASALGPYAAITLLGTRGLDRRAGEALRAFVSAGGGLFVAAGDDFDPQVAGGLLGDDVGLRTAAVRGTSPAVTLAPIDARHPIVRPFGALAVNLGQVRFTRTVTLNETGWQPIARFSDGTAALSERRVGKGRAVFFASDLNGRWNDFPRHPTFVAFVHETLRYLTADRREPSAYLLADAPAGIPRRPGVVTVGVPPRRVAVNVDPRESDPARLSEAEFLSSIHRADQAMADAPRAIDRQTEQGQGYWRYAVGLVLVTLVVEGLVGRKA